MNIRLSFCLMMSLRLALGYLYFEGNGVPQDFIQTAQWFRKSAEQAEPIAQNPLGYAYFRGLGMSRDVRQAAELFRRAAEQGNALAQGNLGYLFESGQGVPLDYAEAYKWYRLAAEHGDATYKYAFKALASRMTAKQLHEGESRLSSWLQHRATVQAASVELEESRVQN